MAAPEGIEAQDEHAGGIDEQDVRAMVRLMANVAITPGGLMPQKRRLVEGLAELVGADRHMWNVTRWEPDGTAIALSLIHNWSEEQFAAVTEWNYTRPGNQVNMALANHLASAGEQAGSVWTRTMTQITESDWWERERRECDAARRTEMADQILCVQPVPGRQRIVSAIGLHRDVGRPKWTEREARIAHVVFTEVSWLHCAEATPKEDGTNILPLPPRQQTVLTLLIDGKVPKEIAASLGLSVNTVRTYVRDIYAHFRVSGRPELLRRFMTGNGGDVPVQQNGDATSP